MRKKIKILLVIALALPCLYVIVPFINGFGCSYRSEVESSNILIAGVCKNGMLRTITHFKDSGLTISNTMLIAYRKPYLTTISISKDIVTPPHSSENLDSLKTLRIEYLTPNLRRFHVSKVGDEYVLLLRPTVAHTSPANIIYKMKLEGVFSYWE